jgi:hypothetical protein
MGGVYLLIGRLIHFFRTYNIEYESAFSGGVRSLCECEAVGGLF